jgi:hypothetical protein
MERYCNSKTQHTTVKQSQQLFKHAYTSNLYGLGTLTPLEFAGPLLVLFQHELTFLQSESLQTQVLLSQAPDTN